MPNIRTRGIAFESRDGFLLQGEWHSADRDSGQDEYAVIVSPGMGIPSRFYRPFARHLAEKGLAVFLFDFRGIGWSAVEDLRRLNADATTWGQFDLSSAIDRAFELSGGKRLVGIGHSFGGSIFGLADNVSDLSKQVHVCSQSGYYGHFDWKTRLYMLFNIHLAMPLLTRALGYYPAHWLSGSEALPAGFVSEWSAWCLSKNYFMDEKFNVKREGSHASYKGPLLSLSFTDDAFATPESVDAMAAFYENSQVERRHLRPADFSASSFGHFEVFKRGNGRLVWDLIAEWAVQS